MVQAQSMKVFSKAPSSMRYMSHVNLSRNYVMMNDVEKAKKHLDSAEIVWDDYKGIHDKAALFMRKADMLRIENDWEKSLKILEEALEFYRGTEYKLRIAEFHKEIGEFYQRPENPLKNFELAMNAFNEALIIAKELNILRLQAAIYHSMWVACKYFEEWKLCADYMVQHSKVEDQVHQQEIDVYIKKLEHHALLEKQKMVQQGKPSFSDAIIDEVVDLRNENEQLKKRNSELRKIMTDIELLIEKKSHNGNGLFLEKLHQTIQKRQSHHASLETYILECDKTYPEFANSLINLIPSITTMEMKVAKLIRLGLSSQAMSTLCGVTVKSIENHRIRLRKKCKLNPEQSLSSYLQTLK
jgi:tetratricopeptide (TPR) repeat protein